MTARLQLQAHSRTKARRVRLALRPLICAVGLSLGCGHTIRMETMDGRAANFDFRSFQCELRAAAPATAADLTIRYLGVSGIYFEWQGVGLLSAPFFSHQGLLRVATGKGRVNKEAIRKGMAGVPRGAAAAMLIGHAHHDHLLDVPHIAQQHPEAMIYGNLTATNLLAGTGDLATRTKSLNQRLGSWIQLSDPNGIALPIRFMAVPSPHARQGPLFHWAPGSVNTANPDGLSQVPLRNFKQGQPLAFVVDFLNPKRGDVAVRVYLQDAATERSGLSPTQAHPALTERPFDLAVLCIASFHLTDGFPEGLLSDLEPRHVMVTHYRDFFRPPHKPVRFVPMLTNRRANRFLERVAASLKAQERPALQWSAPSCGPSGPGWTMPVPGELLQLKTP